MLRRAILRYPLVSDTYLAEEHHVLEVVSGSQVAGCCCLAQISIGQKAKPIMEPLEMIYQVLGVGARHLGPTPYLRPEVASATMCWSVSI